LTIQHPNSCIALLIRYKILDLVQKLVTILKKSFQFTEQQGFKSCYLETTKELWQAVKLYEKLGFKYLDQPKGNTGHSHACEIWMQKLL